MKYFFLLIAFLSTYSFSQNLELSEIMKGDEYIGYQPNSVKWNEDASKIFFSKQINLKDSKDFSYSINSKDIDTVDNLGSDEVVFELDKNLGGYFLKSGNLYHYDAKSKKSKSIIFTKEYISDIQFNESTQKVIFRISNSLFSYCIENGSIKQLVEFKEGEKPTKSATQLNYLQRQQIELFDHFETPEVEEDNDELPKIPTIYVGSKSVSDIQLTFDGETILYKLVEYTKNKPTQYMEHIRADGYSLPKNARPKVGIEEPKFEVHSFSTKTHVDSLLNFNSLTGIKTKAEFLRTVYNDTEEYESAKTCYIHGPYLSPKNNFAIYELKSTDNKDRWIIGYDLKSQKIVEFEHLYDDAWIGGPLTTGWNMVPGKIKWTKDGVSFYFTSEKSGYEHIYRCDVNTRKTTQLTSGEWEVHNYTISKDASKLYVSANKSHPGNLDFYSLHVKSKELTPILIQEGNHDVSISPDEKWLAVRYSYKNKPWEIYLAPNKPNAELQQLTFSQTKEFKTQNWIAPEVITFKADDGENVNARIYEPSADKKNGAAVIFVHGAGYLQNAHNWWSGYHREYMFHNFLVEQGYTVLDIDYRASKGYGRDHRTAIYRHMGGKDLSDHIDGKKLLVEKYGINTNKVGIYGGSYGGFITLMAMLTEPEVFQCGAAIRSVTDWAHYNHAYTSNILNTPEEDSIAYRQSSPIYFADNLQGELLMLHGMVDDNVQFEDVVRLSQRFIELGKEDWELAVYPVEAHGFQTTSSWVDEYSRIFKLFERNLR